MYETVTFHRWYINEQNIEILHFDEVMFEVTADSVIFYCMLIKLHCHFIREILSDYYYWRQIFDSYVHNWDSGYFIDLWLCFEYPFVSFSTNILRIPTMCPGACWALGYKVELVTYRLGLVSSLIAARSLDVEPDKWRIIIRGRVTILTGLKLRLGYIEMWNKALSLS